MKIKQMQAHTSSYGAITVFTPKRLTVIFALICCLLMPASLAFALQTPKSWETGVKERRARMAVQFMPGGRLHALVADPAEWRSNLSDANRLWLGIVDAHASKLDAWLLFMLGTRTMQEEQLERLLRGTWAYEHVPEGKDNEKAIERRAFANFSNTEPSASSLEYHETQEGVSIEHREPDDSSEGEFRTRYVSRNDTGGVVWLAVTRMQISKGHTNAATRIFRSVQGKVSEITPEVPTEQVFYQGEGLSYPPEVNGKKLKAQPCNMERRFQATPHKEGFLLEASLEQTNAADTSLECRAECSVPYSWNGKKFVPGTPQCKEARSWGVRDRAAGENFPLPPEQPYWMEDADARRTRVAGLYTKEWRPSWVLPENSSHNLNLEDASPRWLWQLEEQAKRPDVRIFYLADIYYASEGEERVTILKDGRGAAVDHYGKAPRAFMYTRTPAYSRIQLRDSVQPGSDSGEISYTARRGKDGALWCAVSSSFENRYSIQQQGTVMRFAGGKLTSLTPPLPEEKSFFTGKGFVYPRQRKNQDPGLLRCNMQPMFAVSDLAEPPFHLTAYLEQTNPNLYSPSYLCEAECSIPYTWNGRAYVLGPKECKPKGAWGVIAPKE